MIVSLLTAVLLFFTVVLSLVAAAFLYRWRQRRQDDIRLRARQKMLDHWAYQELNGRTMMLDGEGLRRAWQQLI